MAQSALFIAIFYGTQIIWERDFGILTKLMVTPTPRAALAAAVAVVVVAAAFFSALSMTIAGLVLTRERLMGIGQAITMPLFFGSNALYPSSLMPTWIRWLTRINPLSYEVGALRTLLLGTPGNLVVDALALVGAAALGITVASALLGRLAR